MQPAGRAQEAAAKWSMLRDRLRTVAPLSTRAQDEEGDWRENVESGKMDIGEAQRLIIGVTACNGCWMA
jgi:hypothetical protein